MQDCEKQIRLKSLTKLVASFAIVLAAGVLGAVFSLNAKSVFSSLAKPSFAPPASVFAPVWTVLFLLMGIAFYRVWTKGADKHEVRTAIFYFLTQLLFNVLWCVLFFSLEMRLASFVDIIILLIYIVITTLKFFKIDKCAGFLMIPYLLWVTFAAVLNFALFLLNT